MSLRVALRHAWPGFGLDVAFEAPSGITALFGRSGAGKTTILAALAGLMRPDAGRAEVGGAALFDIARGLWLPPHRRQVGYVFQDGRLFPHMSVAGNLAYGRRGRRGGAEWDAVVELLGIEALLARRPARLSGGEKQRVAIGRALLARPRLLLMDEPLAALDGPRKEEILPYIERLRDEAGVPILYVSHAPAEVARLATTIVVLEGGRAACAGPAAEVLADPDVAPLLGVREAGAILAGRVVAQHEDGLTEVAAAGGRLLLPRVAAPVGAMLRVRVAASDVILSRGAPEGLSALNVLAGRVATIREGEGPAAMVQVEAGGERILARVTRRSVAALGLAPGAACHAILKSVSVARADIGRAEGEEGATARGLVAPGGPV